MSTIYIFDSLSYLSSSYFGIKKSCLDSQLWQPRYYSSVRQRIIIHFEEKAIKFGSSLLLNLMLVKSKFQVHSFQGCEKVVKELIIVIKDHEFYHQCVYPVALYIFGNGLSLSLSQMMFFSSFVRG